MREYILDFLRYIKSKFHKKVMVCYGTSLTSSSGYVEMLGMKLPDWYVINSAKGGMNSAWGFANFRRKVLRYKPKIVFMEFAINDAYVYPTYYGTTTLGDSRHHLMNMIAKLLNKKVQVYLMILNPPLNKLLFDRNPAKDRPNYKMYCKMHKEIAEFWDIPFIDMTGQWEKLSVDDFLHYCPDGLHPNALASRDITVPKIMEVLRQNIAT